MTQYGSYFDAKSSTPNYPHLSLFLPGKILWDNGESKQWLYRISKFKAIRLSHYIIRVLRIWFKMKISREHNRLRIFRIVPLLFCEEIVLTLRRVSPFYFFVICAYYNNNFCLFSMDTCEGFVLALIYVPSRLSADNLLR